MSTSDEAARQFGFTVSWAPEHEADHETQGDLFVDEHGIQRRPEQPVVTRVVVPEDWWVQVSLGWECDPITTGDHESAVREMEQFVAEAQEALAALRERREYGCEESADDPE